MTPAAIQVRCSGPGGETVSSELTDGSARFEELAAGPWTVTAIARNADGVAIGSGSAQVEIEPTVENTVSILIRPVEGVGSFALTAQWPEELVERAGFEAAIAPSAGASIPLEAQVGTTSASIRHDAIPAGYYTLAYRLLDGEAVVAGGAETVRILAEQTTTGLLDFSGYLGSPGSLTGELTVNLDDPLSLEVAGQQDRMALGQQLLLKAWPQPPETELLWVWYVDGIRGATEPTATIGADLELGVHRVDLVSHSLDLRSAGSATVLLEVLPDFPVGSLALSTVYRDNSGGIDGLSACRSLVSSAGDLYVSGYGEDAIAWFRRDPETGWLRFSGAYTAGLGGAAELDGVDPLELSPDGRFLFAGGVTSGTLLVFRRDSSSGALTQIIARSSAEPGCEALSGIRSVALSPDGEHVYTAGATPGALAVWSFDPAGGSLELIESHTDGAPGLDRLGGAVSVDLSPNGAQLAVACFDDDSLLIFDRDPASGRLTLSETLVDETEGCSGLNGASCVRYAPDGASLSVAAYYDNAVSVFTSDGQDGSLVPVQLFKEGVAGVEGLYHAQALSLSPDGVSLYAAASASDGVAVFDRSPVTGSLVYRGRIAGMEGARGLTLSPDGRTCYVAAAGANAVYLLNRRQ